MLETYSPMKKVELVRRAWHEACRRSFWLWLTGGGDVAQREFGLGNLAVRTQDEWAPPGQEIRRFPSHLYLQRLSELAEAHPKIAVLKSRKVLGTWWAAAKALHNCLYFPAREWIMQCKKQEESDTRLLGRMWFMYEHLPSWMGKGFVRAKRTQNAITFANGSIAVAVQEGPNAYRSPTASGIVIDEFPLLEECERTLEAAIPSVTGKDRNMPLYLIGTPNGRDLFWRVVEDADQDGCLPEDVENTVRGELPHVPGVKDWNGPAMSWRLGSNGFLGVKIHATADPEKDPSTEAGRLFWQRVEQQYRQNPLGLKREFHHSTDTSAGKPVYGLVFTRARHVRRLAYMEGKVVYRGWDFGHRRPACVWAFENEKAQLCFYREFLGKDIAIGPFADVVHALSKRWFPKGTKFMDFADPAGWSVSDTSERPRIQILSDKMIFCMKGVQNPIARVETVLGALRDRTNDGTPGLLVDESCRITIEGMLGGYRYPEPKAGLPEAVSEIPVKDGFFDHIMNACEYLVTGLRLPTGKSIAPGRPGRKRDEYFKGLSETTGW